MKLTRFMVVMTSFCTAVCMAQQGQLATGITPQKVVVELPDGSRLLGTLPANTAFSVQSWTTLPPVAIKRIDTITMSDDHKKAVIVMLNGEKIEGMLAMPPLTLTTMLGNVAVDMRVVKTLVVIPTPDAAGTDGLVFSNTLASYSDLAHSAVGPGLKPYPASNDREIQGAQDFVMGKQGDALTLKGHYKTYDRIHNVILEGLDKLINPEQGTIDFWYCQVARPVDESYGIYRMFDGACGVGGCIGLYSSQNTIFFNITCGGQTRELTCPITAIPNNEWIHMAAVWNRKGIDGSEETMRLYINGTKIAAANWNDWGTTPAGSADICGGADADCAGKFMMSNLKVWNRAEPQAPAPGQPAWQPPKAFVTPNPESK
jgi:hypothetical protein